MTTFVLGPDEDKASIVAGLNYLLANQGQAGLTVDQGTGQVIDPVSRNVVQYLYEYIHVRYANNNNGTLDFSSSPTNTRFYGLRNDSNNNESLDPTVYSNPANYVWYETANGFGTTSYLFYLTNGGRQVQWDVNDSALNNSWVQAIDNTPIDLDIVTTATTQSIVTINIYRRSATNPGVPTGGLYDFSSLVLTPPIGWSASVPAGTDPIWISTNVFTNPAAGNIAGPSNPWTAPVIVSQNGTSKSTYNMVAYVREPSQPTTPLPNTGSWNFTTNSGTPPTGADGSPWQLTVPSGNIQLWASTAVVSIIGFTGTATPSTWTTPAELSGTGQNGTSSLVGFARVPNNPVPVTGAIITPGTSYPTSAESLATWGFNATWDVQDPDPASAYSLYQTTGIFDPAVNQTTWQTPYIVSLVTSQLSAITPALGTITSGNIVGNTSVNTSGNIQTSGYFIGNGSQLTSLPIQPGTYTNSNVAAYLSSGTVTTSIITTNSLNGSILNLGPWEISLTPTNGLLFSHSGANLMVLNTNGNLIVAGNVTPNGTVV